MVDEANDFLQVMETSVQTGIASSFCFFSFNIERVLGSACSCPSLVSLSGNGGAVTSESQTLVMVSHMLSLSLLSESCLQKN